MSLFQVIYFYRKYNSQFYEDYRAVNDNLKVEPNTIITIITINVIINYYMAVNYYFYFKYGIINHYLEIIFFSAKFFQQLENYQSEII